MKKISMIVVASILSLNLLTGTAQAGVAIESELASGILRTINPDNSITLDNNQTYFPNREDIRVNLPLNTVVTIRFIRQGEKKLFFEVAAGQNTLPLQVAPAGADTVKDKKVY